VGLELKTKIGLLRSASKERWSADLPRKVILDSAMTVNGRNDSEPLGWPGRKYNER